METPSVQKPIHSLVIDTGPLIKNTVSTSTLVNQAEELLTTPAIISEVRDEATRSRVETTLRPFLKIRSPRPASYEAVAAFSKRTGDFPVLSRQDLGILALAYEVHCEKNGGPWGLRNAPGEDIKKRPEEADGTNPDTESVTKNEKSTEEITLSSEQKDPSGMPSGLVQESEEPTPVTESLEETLSNLNISQPTSEAQEDPVSSSDSDSDGDWITPNNLAAYQAKDSGISTKTTKQIQMDVATMTTDFAMQNVLLQMNLKLLSTNLQRIKNVRSYILRCHACFLTTKQMDRQFCPRCGQPTLNRVSCSTNANGEFKIHLAKNHQWNNRGNKYSVPKPIGGTSNGKYKGKGGGQGGWGRDLIFTEDQKEYVKQMGNEKRNRTRDLMDADYLPSILTGDRERAGGRPKVGAGRNVNSRKRF